MVRIITDSTADLGPELANRFGITVLPLAVHLDGQSYLDGVDISQGQLFSLVEQTGELPKTAAPSLAAFTQAFQGRDEAVFVGISSRLSGTVQNARLAAEDVSGCVRVVDSLNLSTGIGLLVLRAAELRDAGASADQISAAVDRLIPLVRTSFVLDTLQYLYMGGRCSALQSIVGSLLRLRPIIDVRPDGTLGVKEKVRGSRQRSLDALLGGLVADLPRLDRRRVFVTHAACPDDAEYLVDAVRRLANPKEVLITEAGAVISSHCGPRTIGILYALQEP